MQLQNFLSNTRDELAWVREREPRARAQEVGQDLGTAHALLAQHRIFDAEVAAHADLIGSVVGEGQKLAEGGHYASEELSARARELEDAYIELSGASGERMELLKESVDAQQLVSDSQDAVAWCEFVYPQAASEEYGEQASLTQALLSRHATLLSDVEAHAAITARLIADGSRLVEEGNTQAAAIIDATTDAETALRRVQAAAELRQTRLRQRRDRHELQVSSAETGQWLEDRLTVASAIDIGVDQEDCEVLRARFDDFCRDVAANESERVIGIAQQVETLTQAGDHAEAETLRGLVQTVRAGWSELQAAIAKRQEQLEGAHEVHAFDREAEELLLRVAEKDAIASNKEVGRDLASVQALLRAHDGFEHDVKALGPPVMACVKRAGELAGRYAASRDALVSTKDQLTRAWDVLQEKTRM